VKAGPGGAGLVAAAMVAQPRQAYGVVGAEPERELSKPSATVAAMSAAQLVVALSAFESATLRDTADVMLPIAPFTETSGTFVNCEGRAQSFAAVARPVGDKWIVTSGLKPGDKLSVEGLVNLRPGTVVTPGAPQQVTAAQAAPRGPQQGGAN